MKFLIAGKVPGADTPGARIILIWRDRWRLAAASGAVILTHLQPPTVRLFGGCQNVTGEVARIVGAGVPNERTLENAAACVADWMKVLRSDKRAIISAASAGSAAVDYILSFSQVEQPEELEELEEVPF